MMHKRMDPPSAFVKVAGGSNKKMNKAQWREALRKEGLPFNCIQMDFLHEKLDLNHDGYLDV